MADSGIRAHHIRVLAGVAGHLAAAIEAVSLGECQWVASARSLPDARRGRGRPGDPTADRRERRGMSTVFRKPVVPVPPQPLTRPKSKPWLRSVRKLPPSVDTLIVDFPGPDVGPI